MKTKKKQIKNFLKLGILLFGISLLLVNCEKEEFVSQQKEIIQEEITTPLEPKIETFSLNQLNKDTKFNELKKTYNILQNNSLSKSASGSTFSVRLIDTLGVTINANTIKKIVYDNYVSYTMQMIELEDTSGNFSNLVIQESNGIKRIFTVRYFPYQNNSYASKSAISSASSESFSGDIQMRSGIGSYTEPWGDPDPDPDSGGGGTGGTSVCEDQLVCNNVTVYIPVACGCGHLSNQGCQGSTCGPPSNPYYDEITQEECEIVCVYVNYNPDNPGDTGGNIGGGGSTSPVDDTTPTNVATTPINEDGSSAAPQSLISMLGITDQTQIGWIYDINNIIAVDNMWIYGAANNWSDYAGDFIEIALEAEMREDGDEVDYENSVILDSTFANNPKAKCVYEKLKQAGGIKDILKDYFDTNQTANLVLKLAPNMTCGTAANPFGCTSFNENTQTATITLDEDFITQFQFQNAGGVYQTPLLYIAKVIIHEAIHAQLFYNKYQLSQGNPVSDLTFEELYEDYRGVKGWQHQFMAEHHLGITVEALEEVHPLLNDQSFIDYINNNFSTWTWSQIYKNMSWTGLTQTPAGQTYLSDPANSTLYSLQNIKVAVNSNETHNCN